MGPPIELLKDVRLFTLPHTAAVAIGCLLRVSGRMSMMVVSDVACEFEHFELIFVVDLVFSIPVIIPSDVIHIRLDGLVLVHYRLLDLYVPQLLLKEILVSL